MDAIFKALGDPARRSLLDSLREKDGQTLTELQAQLDMTRFGVMKHLGVLEDASLIVTTKKGRFKYHYLNAVPLQEAIDRWIDPLLAKPAARAVIDLKSKLEGPAPMTAHATGIKPPDYIHQTIIKCSPEALWEALTSGEITPHYFFETTLDGDVVPGNTVTYRSSDGAALLTCEVIAAEPFTRLEMTFLPHWLGEDATTSRHVYRIEEAGAACRLTIEHYDLPPDRGDIRDGWVLIASRLKTWLETGQPMGPTTLGDRA